MHWTLSHMRQARGVDILPGYGPRPPGTVSSVPLLSAPPCRLTHGASGTGMPAFYGEAEKEPCRGGSRAWRARSP